MKIRFANKTKQEPTRMAKFEQLRSNVRQKVALLLKICTVPILGALTPHRALAAWITRIILRKQLLLVSYSCPVQIYFCDMWQLYAHMMSWVKNSRVSAPILGALTPHPALAAWITRTILRKQLLLVNYSYPSQIDFWDMWQVYAKVYELS